MQRENEEMKEQENSSLWQDSPHQNSGQNRGTPKEIFSWVMVKDRNGEPERGE
jgi:hypothetical protein